MIISFTGHARISQKNHIKEIVKKEIRSSAAGTDSVTCYIGGYGDFDEICAYACQELKSERDGIEVVYVTPYISMSAQVKIQGLQEAQLCDASLYPPIENVPSKYAISKRNEWMMANADLVIAYVSRSYGGAYQSLQIAKRKKKRIINIFDLVL